jgi:hypothetical protein
LRIEGQTLALDADGVEVDVGTLGEVIRVVATVAVGECCCHGPEEIATLNTADSTGYLRVPGLGAAGRRLAATRGPLVAANRDAVGRAVGTPKRDVGSFVLGRGCLRDKRNDIVAISRVMDPL